MTFYSDDNITVVIDHAGLHLLDLNVSLPLVDLEDPVDARLATIDLAVERGLIDEPAASCLAMLVEEPWNLAHQY